MYSSIALNPASSLAASTNVHSHFLSVCRHGSLPINRRATWSWNPPRIWPTRGGVTTHVYAPKLSTDWTTDFNKNQDTRGAIPSLLIILINLCHTARAFARFLNTASQFLSADNITRPNYLKEVNISSVCPYVLKTLDVTGLSSYVSRSHHFRSAPFLHCVVH